MASDGPVRTFRFSPTLVRRSGNVAALALFVVLAIIHTWPLASAPAMLSRNDASDTLLHEWTLAWVAHQVVRQPLHLFDANIFYPERLTLAYSDHLFVQSMMVAPLLWVGGSPVLAYNVALIAGFALTGWAMCLLVRRWTGSWLAGVLSGSLAAFNAFTLTRLPQVQDQHMEFFPFALLSLDQLLNQLRLKWALRLALWFVLESLTCGYVLVFAFLSLLVATASRPTEWLGRRFKTIGLAFLVASGTASALLLPFMIPYLIVSRSQGLTRPLWEVALYSAQFSDYLATGGTLHYNLWSHNFFKADALFPGVVALSLAAVAVAAGAAAKDARARMTLAFGIAAFAFSFGANVSWYKLLYYGFPLMKGIRGAARYGQFFLISVAILAGFGLVVIQRRVRRGALALSLALIAVANLEALRAPVHYSRFEPIAPVYAELRRTSNAVVACFPFYGGGSIFENTRYMLASTRFWKPLLNGYSGFAPVSFYDHLVELSGFPDRRAIDFLRTSGVTHVVVEGNMMAPARLAEIPNYPELSLWRTGDNVRIYLLR